MDVRICKNVVLELSWFVRVYRMILLMCMRLRLKFNGFQH